jgi:hypothetical protein
MSRSTRKVQRSEVSSVQVTVTRGDPNEMGKMILGLIVIAIGAYLAYLLTVNFLIPFVGTLIFAGMGVMSAFFLFRKPKDFVDDTSVPLVQAYSNQLKKSDPEMTEEKAFTWMLTALMVAVALYVLLAAIVAGYALDPQYQRFPINYVGMAYFVAIVGQIALGLKTLAALPKMKTEPWKPLSSQRRVFNNFTNVLGVAYPLAVFAVKFGIL